jgi:hypothetical protein
MLEGEEMGMPSKEKMPKPIIGTLIMTILIPMIIILILMLMLIIILMM